VQPCSVKAVPRRQEKQQTEILFLAWNSVEANAVFEVMRYSPRQTDNVVGSVKSPGTSLFPGLVTTRVRDRADVKLFFDRCASQGSSEQHGDAEGLLRYRLALVRSLARPQPTDVVLDLGCGTGHHLVGLGPEIARGIGIDISPGMIELAGARVRDSLWRAKLTFEVDDAERLHTIPDQSIDLAICIGSFEHMLDKEAVLASIVRVLKSGGRFFCLTPHADYIWYRTLAPLLGIPTKHLSSDRFMTRNEFSALLRKSGFHRNQCTAWSFIPKGDMPSAIAILLTFLDAIGRRARWDSLRGGLALCARKEAPPASASMDPNSAQGSTQ